MVQSERGQQRLLLVGGGEQLGSLARTYDLKRVRVEGDQDASAAQIGRLPGDLADHLLVAQVHAVERADRRDDGPTVARQLLDGAGKPSHGAKTLRGLSKPSRTAPTATSARSGDTNAAHSASGAEEGTVLPIPRC